MMHIAVVDYGMGNLRSVSKAIEHVAAGRPVLVTSDAADIDEAERVVFPGQGAMPDCMRELERAGLREAVVRAAAAKPLLGICIGAQMLFDWSAEGDTPGLGTFRGRVVRFPPDRLHDAPGGPLKVPHMGWNRVHQTVAHALWRGIGAGERFYFCHSYFFVPEE
ncbi:MAG TPA: imidazole glycerol phosphate synthase subunit HisH, partial [Burkholderiales bacterium]|nr:imidazole glycerol phosphate synthase subunit HisH [Burkholderiales bacterium]